MRFPLTLALTSALLGPGLVWAQTTIYKQRDAQGRLIFSDRPISQDAQVSENRPASSATATNGAAALPVALRDVVARFSVTLYSAKDCQPCDNGRAMLTARGVPFSEKTVLTPEDGQALTQLSGGLTVPLLTIGSQQLKGFSESSWSDYLLAAGYPPQSALPAGYSNPAPRPMVEPQPAPTPAPAPVVRPTPVAPSPVPAGAGSQNPAGIIF